MVRIHKFPTTYTTDAYFVVIVVLRTSGHIRMVMAQLAQRTWANYSPSKRLRSDESRMSFLSDDKVKFRKVQARNLHPTTPNHTFSKFLPDRTSSGQRINGPPNNASNKLRSGREALKTDRKIVSMARAMLGLRRLWRDTVGRIPRFSNASQRATARFENNKLPSYTSEPITAIGGSNEVVLANVILRICSWSG
ncbi:uncharacterized protein BDR25DRAFT_343654 [Lindgomyces ingoldianus]|uniref:Uncharacterized protein n=1 Tax=Lindgomyces ingoldianus TaxID=673940 RepID=A0ACB6QU42_9PLEO|nr:uncharacterized protein BDR25DRAFT_343654 [Lindgomyces ingoldianus]KAF2469686.1 hypothetical protein BDR25DRAFT_343654 [Lindgomyces ingoldianus]